MKQAMKKMGIAQQEIDATEVIIRTADKEIVITEPEVSKINMMGQQTYQIVGNEHEREIDSTPDINEEDIKTVSEQAGVSMDEAKEALLKSKGDIAQAIMDISENSS